MQQEFINDDEKKVLEVLNSIGQGHLMKDRTKFSQEQRKEFVDQVNALQKSCPGGLGEYTKRAQKLLKDSASNVNPFEGFVPSVPVGETIDSKNLNQVNSLEQVGIQEIQHTCFVLVAGGLGERLGYNGIKVGIPLELVTKQVFLRYYLTFIKAFQKRCPNGTKIPLAIMTSDDTDKLTRQLLNENDYFGFPRDQLTIMKQEKVPSMIDNEARFAQVKDSLLIETKPHGHGDVHVLLHLTGLVEKWKKEGKKWVVFFQDTNPLVFRAIPSVLGVSKNKNLEVNTITVPRKPGEAVGAICKLTNAQKQQSLTINVEYNQLGPLLKATVGNEQVDGNGYSVFPGNTNALVFSIPEYSVVLKETQGCIAEFINPKYADETKTKFKSATRLECMMQDYPKLLKNPDRVGFTQLDRFFCFSTCKNDLKTAAQKCKDKLAPECAGSCENDFYFLNAKLLAMAGAQVEFGTQAQSFEGIDYAWAPKIVLSPDFGVTVEEIKSKLKGKLVVTAGSTLVLNGNLSLGDVFVDGSLKLEGNAHFASIEVKDKKYDQFVKVDLADKSLPNYLTIRGYTLANQF